MSGKETIAKQLRLPVLGLIFMLLFTFQVNGAVRFFPLPAITSSSYAAEETNQKQSLWQLEENSSCDGLLTESHLAFTAALVFCLILAFSQPLDEENVLSVFPTLVSRNFCCIVPKGP